MRVSFTVKILIIALFMLHGCATVKESMKVSAPKSSPLRADVLAFKDLKEIDLDNDGEKEIVAVYTAGLNTMGVKVIKNNGSSERNVIFSKKFDSNNVKFEVRKGIPTLITKNKDSAGCGVTKTYTWNGREFAVSP